MRGRRRRRRQACRGFGMIEAIVALGLLALVLAIAVATLRIGQRAWQAGLLIERGALEPAFRDAVAERIARAYPLVMRNADGRLLTAFAGTGTRLRFVSASSTGPAGGDLYEYDLTEVSDGERHAVLLLQRPFRRADWEGPPLDGAWQQSRLEVPAAGALRLRYFGSQAAAGERTWHAQWPRQERLPELIEITIEAGRARHVPLIVEARYANR